MPPTLSAKQAQMKRREEQILEVARGMLVTDGYHGLNMERIADEVQASKGTVYNHFANKEEIIVALAMQSAAIRVDQFRRAAQFRDRPRFRMMAIGFAAERFAREFADFFLLEQILQLPSVRQKVPDRRQHLIDNSEVQCMSVVAGVVRDAIAAEDLSLPEQFTPEQLVFGLWALTSGGFAIASSNSLAHIGLEQPYQTIADHTAALLDGFGWQPLSPTYDPHEILERIEREVFPS